MKKINNHLNESVYYYVSATQLPVYIVTNQGFKKSIAVYGTDFGSLHGQQRYKDQLIHHKEGIAHFLEHKLFEDERRSVLSQFADLGANANAFTSFDCTMYYFSTHDAIAEPLKLLLDFVSHFSISEASVEKEKNIIIEEINMYKEMPDMVLLMKTYENLFHHYPLKIDIAGSIESVSATTLADLERAYQLNYHDDRMALVVVSPEDPQLIKEIIDQCVRHHPVSPFSIANVPVAEPLTVVKKKETITGRVLTPKMSLSYKFSYDGISRVMDEFLLRTLIEMNFSSTNDYYQSWLDDAIISDHFSFDVDLREGFGVVYFFNESEKAEAFHQVIDAKMKQLVVDEKLFSQLIKRFYGQMVMSLSQFDRLAINIAKFHFDGLNYYDYLKAISHVSFADLNNVAVYLESLDSSFLVMQAAPE